MTCVWVRRSPQEPWHACLDYWDTQTLCGKVIGAGQHFDDNPTGWRCEACELKVMTHEAPTKTGVGSP